MGPNGAGKSTLLRIISSLARTNQGEVLLQGAHIFRGAVGYLGHELGMYGSLTVAENISLFAQLSPTPEQTLQAAQRLLTLWSGERYLHTQVSLLSKGWQRKVALAKILSAPYKLFALDEPTAPLDDFGTEQLISTLQESDALTLIATHDVTRLKRLATRILVIDRGGCAIDSATYAREKSMAAREAIDECLKLYAERNR